MSTLTQSQANTLNAEIDAQREQGKSDEEIKTFATQRASSFNTENIESGAVEPEKVQSTKTNELATDANQNIEFDVANAAIAPDVEKVTTFDADDEFKVNENAYGAKKNRFDIASTLAPELLKGYLGNDYESYKKYKSSGYIDLNEGDISRASTKRKGRKLRDYVGTLPEEDRINFIPVIDRYDADVISAANEARKDTNQSGKVFSTRLEEYGILQQTLRQKQKEQGGYLSPEDALLLADNQAGLKNLSEVHKNNINISSILQDESTTASLFKDEIKRTHSVMKRLFGEEGVFDQTGDSLAIAFTEIMSLGGYIDNGWAENWNKEAKRDYAAGEKWRNEFASRNLELGEVEGIGDLFEFLGDGLVDNAPMLALYAASIPLTGGLSALGLAPAVATRVASIAMSSLMGFWSAGGKIGEYSHLQGDAKDRLKEIDAKILRAVGDEKAQLIQSKTTLLRDANRTRGQMIATGVAHGVSEAFWEYALGSGFQLRQLSKGLAKKVVQNESKAFAKRHAFEILNKEGREAVEFIYKNSYYGAKGVQSVTSEGLSEVLTTISQNTADNIIGGENKNIFEGVAESFIHGAFMGGLLGSVNTGVETYFSRPLKTARDQDHYNEIMEQKSAIREQKLKADITNEEWNALDKKEYELDEKIISTRNFVFDRAAALTNEETWELWETQRKIDMAKIELQETEANKDKISPTAYEATISSIKQEISTYSEQLQQIADVSLRWKDVDLLTNPGKASIQQLQFIEDRLKRSKIISETELNKYREMQKTNPTTTGQVNIVLLQKRIEGLDQGLKASQGSIMDKFEGHSDNIQLIDSTIQQLKDSNTEITQILKDGGGVLTKEQMTEMKAANTSEIKALNKFKEKLQVDVDKASKKAGTKAESTKTPEKSKESTTSSPKQSTDTTKDSKEAPKKTSQADYAKKLADTKKSDPKQYWSVDSVSATEKGKVITVEGGNGFVSPDGDVKGVFGDGTVKGAAPKILKAAVEAGGIKLDNFDLPYLTKIYKKAGFRITSRTPFNEEFAPEGWNEAAHGKPDVVAMIYDPEGKLDIEEKSFDDYDDMIKYRDSFVKDAKAGVQHSRDLLAKAQEPAPKSPAGRKIETKPRAKRGSIDGETTIQKIMTDRFKDRGSKSKLSVAQEVAAEIAKDTETVLVFHTRVANALAGAVLTNKAGVQLSFQGSIPSRESFKNFLKDESGLQIIHDGIVDLFSRDKKDIRSWNDPITRSLITAIQAKSNIRIVPVDLPFGVDGQYIYGFNGDASEIQLNSNYVARDVLWHEAGHAWVALVESQRPTLFNRAVEELHHEENASWYSKQKEDILGNPVYANIWGNIDAIDREILTRALERGPTTKGWKTVLAKFLQGIAEFFGIKGVISPDATIADIAKLAQIEIATGETVFVDIVDGREQGYDPSFDSKQVADSAAAAIQTGVKSFSSGTFDVDSQPRKVLRRAKEELKEDLEKQGRDVSMSLLNLTKEYPSEYKQKVAFIVAQAQYSEQYESLRNNALDFNIDDFIALDSKGVAAELKALKQQALDLTTMIPFLGSSQIGTYTGRAPKGAKNTKFTHKDVSDFTKYRIEALESLAKRTEETSAFLNEAAKISSGKVSFRKEGFEYSWNEVKDIPGETLLKNALSTLLTDKKMDTKGNQDKDTPNNNISSVNSRTGSAVLPGFKISEEFRRLIEGGNVDADGNIGIGKAKEYVNDKIEKVKNLTPLETAQKILRYSSQQAIDEAVGGVEFELFIRQLDEGSAIEALEEAIKTSKAKKESKDSSELESFSKEFDFDEKLLEKFGYAIKGIQSYLGDSRFLSSSNKSFQDALVGAQVKREYKQAQKVAGFYPFRHLIETGLVREQQGSGYKSPDVYVLAHADLFKFRQGKLDTLSPKRKKALEAKEKELNDIIRGSEAVLVESDPNVPSFEIPQKFTREELDNVQESVRAIRSTIEKDPSVNLYKELHQYRQREEELLGIVRNASGDAKVQGELVYTQNWKKSRQPMKQSQVTKKALRLFVENDMNQYTREDDELSGAQRDAMKRLTDSVFRTSDLVDEQTFYHDYYFDKRGREYVLTNVFNHQGSKWAKALHYIDVDGWNAVAESYGMNKIGPIKETGYDAMLGQAIELMGLPGTKPFNEQQRIDAAKSVPNTSTIGEKWSKIADNYPGKTWEDIFKIWAKDYEATISEWGSAKEFPLFFSTINEVYQAHATTGGKPFEYVSGLPYYRDATNSGVQILSAVSLDADAALKVNLRDVQNYEDLYRDGGQGVLDSIKASGVLEEAGVKEGMDKWLKEYSDWEQKLAEMDAKISKAQDKKLDKAVKKLREENTKLKKEFQKFNSVPSPKSVEKEIGMLNTSLDKAVKLSEGENLASANKDGLNKYLRSELFAINEMSEATLTSVEAAEILIKNTKKHIKEAEAMRPISEARAKAIDYYIGTRMNADNIRDISKSPVMTKVYSAGVEVRAKDLVRSFKPKKGFTDLNLNIMLAFVTKLDTSLAEIIPLPIQLMKDLGTFAGNAVKGYKDEDGKQVTNEPQAFGALNDFHWIQSYNKSYIKQLAMKRITPKGLGKNSVYQRANYTLGDAGLDVGQHKSGIVPNFVHFLDAQLVAGVTLSTKNPLITIHDSFATTFDNADSLRGEIDASFLQMFDFASKGSGTIEVDGKTIADPNTEQNIKKSVLFKFYKSTLGSDKAAFEALEKQGFTFGDYQVKDMPKNVRAFSSSQEDGGFASNIPGIDYGPALRQQTKQAEELGITIGTDSVENAKAIAAAGSKVFRAENVEKASVLKAKLSKLFNKESKGASGQKSLTKPVARLLGAQGKRKFGHASEDIYGLISLITPIAGKSSEKLVQDLHQLFLTDTWEAVHSAQESKLIDIKTGLNKIKKDTGLTLSKLEIEASKVNVRGVEGVPYTKSQALAAYLFNKQGKTAEMLEMDQKDFDALVSEVSADEQLTGLADALYSLTGGWVTLNKETPGDWVNTSTTFLITRYFNKEWKQEKLKQYGWVDVRKELFNEDLYNQIIATYSNGEAIVESMKSVISGMWTGSTFETESKTTKGLVKFASHFTAMPMIFNPAVGVKQLFSYMNFYEVSGANRWDKAWGARFDPDFIKTVKAIWNSDYGQNRLGAKAFDVDFGQLTEEGKLSSNGIINFMSKLRSQAVEKAFLPISYGDLGAIAFGGASYVINYKAHFMTKINPETGVKYTESQAFDEAMKKMQANAESTQQSKKATRVSAEQRTVAGKLTLSFRTAQQQANRRTREIVRRIKRLGKDASTEDYKAAIGNILFYQLVSPTIFSLVGGGIFSALFGDDEDRKGDLYERAMWDVIDFGLVGFGMWGAATATVLKLFKEVSKQWREEDYDGWKAFKQLLNITPSLSIIAKQTDKVAWAAKTQKPWEAAHYTSDIIFPTSNVTSYFMNQQYLMDEQVNAIDKLHIFLGWKPWMLDIEEN